MSRTPKNAAKIDDPFAVPKRRGRPPAPDSPTLVVRAELDVSDGDILSPRRRALVDEYVVDYHVGRAARRSGWSLPAAHRQLATPAAQAYLREILRERAVERTALEQRIVEELCVLAFYRLDAVVDANGQIDLTRLSDDDPRRAEILVALQGQGCTRDGTPVYKFADRVRALELLGKHVGMWVERRELSGPGGRPLEIASTVTPREAAEIYAAALEQS